MFRNLIRCVKSKQILFLLFVILLKIPNNAIAQTNTKYLTEKQGIYSFKNNISYKGADYITFGNNVKILSDYFCKNIPLMKANKGFDLSATLFGIWDDEYIKSPGNYGIRGELNFDFQLFLEENGKAGKWTVEPPHWAFYINNTESGHGGMIKEGNEGSFLKELFLVFPLVKEIAPGVRYYDCEERTCGSLVVYNPDNPPYWLPVTVKEVVDAKLAFYKKDDIAIYEFILPIVSKMSEEDLNAPAYYGSDDAILNVNGKSEGLQIMRFNPAYWDKKLPSSAIQFFTILYSEYGNANKSKDDQQNVETEYLKNNGHSNYMQAVLNTLILKDLAALITKTIK